MAIISIAGLDKAEVLARLFNAAAEHNPEMKEARKLMGSRSRLFLPIALARELIAGGDLMFDYLNTIPLKLDLSGDTFDSSIFDRDNGEGLAERVIAAMRLSTKAPLN